MSLAALDESATALWIGGREFRVGPLRVRHLAALERRILEERVDPLPGLSAALESLTERQQEMLLGRAYDALARGPRVAEGELEAFCESRIGLAEALWLCIHEREPAIHREDLDAAIGSLPARELEELQRQAERAMRLPWGNGRGQAQDAPSC
jgi:hypothetical protein